VRRIVLGFVTCAAFAVAACGYSDPYAGSAPIADESPGPSASPSVSPGADDFGTCNSLSTTTYPDGLKVGDLKVGTGATATTGENA
jgi:hypothetical protein